MKSKMAMFIVVILILTAGCIDLPIFSLSPIHTPDTTVFEKSLLGSWVYDDEEEEKNDARWVFKKGEDNSYAVEITGPYSYKDEEIIVTLIQIGYLVKLGENYFLELAPNVENMEKELFPKFFGFWPFHMIVKIDFEKDSFKIMVPEIPRPWLEKVRDDDPFSVVNNILGTGGIPFVNNQTEAIQEFLIKYGDDEELFSEDCTLKFKKLN